MGWWGLGSGRHQQEEEEEEEEEEEGHQEASKGQEGLGAEVCRGEFEWRPPHPRLRDSEYSCCHHCFLEALLAPETWRADRAGELAEQVQAGAAAALLWLWRRSRTALSPLPGCRDPPRS